MYMHMYMYGHMCIHMYMYGPECVSRGSPLC